MRDPENDQGASTSVPASAFGFPNTPVDQGTPFMGPVDKTGTTASLGMKGKQRFDWVISSQPQLMTMRGHDWDSWIQNLPEDPNDLEYTRLLRQEKTDAVSRERVRIQQASKPIASIDKPSGKFSTDGEVVKMTGPDAGKAVAGGASVGTTSQPGLAVNTGMSRVEANMARRDKQSETKYRKDTTDVPVIIGLPVNDGDIIGDPANAGGVPDEYLTNWLKGQGINLPNDEYKQRAAKSGNWVYVGETADPYGGPGYKRSQYVYVDDAVAQLAAMSPQEIKTYQHKLGAPETGVPTGEVQSAWTEAVKAAQNLARAGKKVELRFVFEQIIAGKVSAARGGGGGGGGGAFSGQLSGADMVGADYYQAMMQVLGDVSGVKP